MKQFDYHTHNGYSGCASKFPYSIKEGWQAIQKRGITKYGISNHFPTRKEFGDYIPQLREEVDNLGNENILLGVELELDQETGINHLSAKNQSMLDFIIGSAHNQPVGFLQLPDIEEEEEFEFFESFENVLLNSFEKIPIDIWGHPFLHEFGNFGNKYWDKFMRPLYIKCLDMCAKQKIAIELTPAYARKCAKQPTTYPILDEMYTLAMEHDEIFFVTSSDAHSLANLGDIIIPNQYIQRFNIPDDRILELFKR
jgi:histidinol phosphatase-like PHP family hydrolase